MAGSMSTMKVDGISRVHAILKTFSGVEPGSTYGFPAFKVQGKTFAWFPEKKDVEKGTLAVRLSILERDFLVKRYPKIYYFTPHYKDYDAVLARVDLMSDAMLRELLASGYEFISRGKKKR